ncbi:MAG: CAAX prenyl protease-related protein [Verrucomicrobiota bacterium]|nr:CAAX prenyl protease-related protein [Verrucomicrobiota bacterium]
MGSATTPRNDRRLIAYAGPMLLFVGSLGLVRLFGLGGSEAFWLRHPEFWIYPVQTLACAGMLIWFRREYEFHRLRQIAFVIAVGVIVFVLWIAPQMFFGRAARIDGFNPDLLAANPGVYWLTLLMRFLRLVVVVPLVEEIFWRGLLLRYFIDERFERVPFGAFSWLSFGVVTVGFTFSHLSADWIAAFITGALYNAVAYRTKSLTSCVLVHAITNLLLGLWIIQTKQWGFW